MPERAEIQAVRRFVNCSGHVPTCARWAVIPGRECTCGRDEAVAYLDRVRDARDDDEACARCGCSAFRCAEQVSELRAALAARSPQGEDHGPEPDALGGLSPSQPKEDE